MYTQIFDGVPKPGYNLLENHTLNIQPPKFFHHFAVKKKNPRHATAKKEGTLSI